MAHADPSAEIPLCLIIQKGEIELTSKRGIRRVKSADFFRGALITDCEVDEMVTALVMPVMQACAGIAFEEINERHGDFAIVAAAAWAVRDGDSFRYGLGLGGLHDHPLASHGTTIGGIEAVQEAVTTIICNSEPLDDRRASATYRRHLAVHLGECTLQQALENAS